MHDFDSLWEGFLAYQAQFYAQDFVSKHPRQNKARFIKYIRALLQHPQQQQLGIDLEGLLAKKDSPTASDFLSLQKLCELFNQNDCFVLSALNKNEQVSVMLFKPLNTPQWHKQISTIIQSSAWNTAHTNTGSQASPAQSPQKTRRRADPLATLTLDVNVQQQNEVQNLFQIEVLQSIDIAIENEDAIQTPEVNRSISFEEFWERIKNSPQPLPVSKQELRHQWCHWTAGQVVFNSQAYARLALRELNVKEFEQLKTICAARFDKITRATVANYKSLHFTQSEVESIQEVLESSPDGRTIIAKLVREKMFKDGDIQLTYEAASELFKFRHLFQAGVDIYHLPAGFSLSKKVTIEPGNEQSVYLLDYLPRLKEIAEPSALAIVCCDHIPMDSAPNPLFTLDDAKTLFKIYMPNSEQSLIHLYHHALKQFKDSASLQANDEYMQAIEVILNLPPSQRLWWEQLLEQHTSHCGYDHLPSLVRTFQKFVKQVSQYPQHFEFYPPQFRNIKSMPLALTQMLALIDNCKDEDRHVQWDVISTLPLTGYEVGSALRRTYVSSFSFGEKQEACTFILPEMKINEPQIFEEGRTLFPSEINWNWGYFLLERRSKPTSFDQDVERLFYLALSHKRFTLPIRFYREKIAFINQSGLDIPTQRKLYRILLESCTGTTSRFVLIPPEEINEAWEKFIRKICSVQWGITAKTTHLLKKLNGLLDIPNIHQINQLVASVGASSDDTIDIITDTFNHLLRGGSRSVYAALNKHKDTTYAQLQALDQFFYNLFGNSECHHKLMALLAVFDFAPSLNDHNFNDALMSMREGSEQTLALLTGILDRLSCLRVPEGKPHLSTACFVNFLNAVSQSATHYECKIDGEPPPAPDFSPGIDAIDFARYYTSSDFIDHILNAHFADYVDVDLLAQAELSAEHFKKIEQLIRAGIKAKHGQEIMLTILRKLSFEKHPINDLIDFFSNLITLANNCSDDRQIEFLITIQHHLDRGKLLSRESNRGAQPRLKQLHELLETVRKTGSISRFQFLLAEFENQPAAHATNLIKKLTYTLRTLLPRINQCLGEQSHMQPMVLLLLCKEFISSQRIEDLTQQDNAPPDEHAFLEMLKNMDMISKRYPSHARNILSFLSQCYSVFNRDADSHGIQRTNYMAAYLSELDNPNLLLAITHYFIDPNQSAPLSIVGLESIFKRCPATHRVLFIEILMGQIHQNQEISTKTIENFLNLLTQEQRNETFFAALDLCFKKSPTPSFENFILWWDARDQEDMQKRYQTFSIKPYPRDEVQNAKDNLHNGFNVEKALSQVKYEGLASLSACYTPALIDDFHDKCLKLRDEPIEALLDELFLVKEGSNTSHMLALMAEILYRTTGQEIHTTQYLAVDALLRSGRHVAAEIDTGEGKTRISMLLIACQAWMGKTIDVVTSDMQLAESAYLEYSNFFKTLHLQSCLITSESNISDYQPGAIHFSDWNHLNLFRNKAHALGLLDKTLDPIPQNRMLFLDEADKTWFDLFNTNYNFSMAADKTLTDIEWVYPQLIQFFSEDGYTFNTEVLNDYYDDVPRCNLKFRNFVQTYGTQHQIDQLKLVTDTQIARWHESAVTALSLKYQIDFTIEANKRINTRKGPRIASEALVISDHKVNRRSKYSNGVHQCLHARLNILRHKKIHAQHPALDKYLHDHCTQAFHIEPENQIITTSSSETLLDYYREGSDYSITGTLGCDKEKSEMAKRFAIMDRDTPLQFIKLPRHKSNLRQDRPLQIVRTNQHKIERIIQEILDAQPKNQPVLVFCENDQEAMFITAQISEQLKKHHTGQAEAIKIRQIHANTPDHEQRLYLAQDAGKPSAVTITTGMFGRGKDIILQKVADRNAAMFGLKTIDLSYPNYRELRQRLGRAARNGQAGETLILLSQEELQTKYQLQHSKKQLNKVEQLLIKRQQFETDKNQLERRVKIALHEYLGRYQKAYFNVIVRALNKHSIPLQNTKWVQLFEEMIANKQTAMAELMGMVHRADFSEQKFEQVTDKLHLAIQVKWNKFLNELVEEKSLRDELQNAVQVPSIQLKDWEKIRLLEIKKTQLRPLRERIIRDVVQSKESFIRSIFRALYNFAQWTSWDALANFIDKRFHFSRPIEDSEIEPLIYPSIAYIEKMLSESPLRPAPTEISNSPPHLDALFPKAQADSDAPLKNAQQP